MFFDERRLDKKSVKIKSLISLLQSPATMAGSLKKNSFSKPKETKIRFLSTCPKEFSDRISFSSRKRSRKNFQQKLMKKSFQELINC